MINIHNTQQDKMEQVTNNSILLKKYSGSWAKSYDSNHSLGDTKKGTKFVFDSKAYIKFGFFRQTNRIKNHENIVFWTWWPQDKYKLTSPRQRKSL